MQGGLVFAGILVTLTLTRPLLQSTKGLGGPNCRHWSALSDHSSPAHNTSLILNSLSVLCLKSSREAKEYMLRWLTALTNQGGIPHFATFQSSSDLIHHTLSLPVWSLLLSQLHSRLFSSCLSPFLSISSSLSSFSSSSSFAAWISLADSLTLGNCSLLAVSWWSERAEVEVRRTTERFPQMSRLFLMKQWVLTVKLSQMYAHYL